MSILSLLSLAAGFCLATGQISDYDQLEPAGLKTYVDMALVNANQQLNFGHLNFYKIGTYKEIGRRVHIDVRLKGTVCKKAGEHKHRPECAFKRLEVRCDVCKPVNRDALSINCVRKDQYATRSTLWAEQCTACIGCNHLIASVDDQP